MCCALSLQMTTFLKNDEEQASWSLIMKAFGHLRRFAQVHLSPTKTQSRQEYIQEVEASMDELFNFACMAEEVRLIIRVAYLAVLCGYCFLHATPSSSSLQLPLQLRCPATQTTCDSQTMVAIFLCKSQCPFVVLFCFCSTSPFSS